MYFNTIVGNISDMVCNDIKRYISWVKKTDSSPRWLTTEDLDIVQRCINNPEILFLRKIKDEKLLKQIISSLNQMSKNI